MLYGRPTMSPIVTAPWVQERLDELTLVDCQWFLDGSEGRSAYRTRHLPGAIWVDLDRDLAAPAHVEAGRHPLPTPDAFAAAMSRIGVKQNAKVVAYDQGHGGFAARLVWMLRVTGHDAALLDGGLAAWPGLTESGDVARAPSVFEPRPWPKEWLADLDDVVARSTDRMTVIVDSRAAERYRGEVEPIDARAGHVPGAINLPFADNLDESGKFLPADSLAARFAEAGVSDTDEVVVYCGSGVTACQNLLAMESVGIQARLYPGSWSQWAARHELPVGTSSDSGRG